MSLLLQIAARGSTGILALGIVLGIGYVGGWPLFALVAVMCIVALSEYYSALQTKGLRPNVLAGWICAILILLATEYGARSGVFLIPVGEGQAIGGGMYSGGDILEYIVVVLVVCAGVSLISQTWVRPNGSPVENSATTVFGVVWLGLLLSFVLRLRQVDAPLCGGFGDAGEFAARAGALTMAILPTWVSDSAAFVAGNLWGRMKLVPQVSPNKTVVGSVAGLVTETIAVVVLGLWLHLPVWHMVFLGIVMSVVGQAGDIGASVIKRDTAIDDFGAICGPHGGLLDRFDAVLPTLPVVYWYFWVFWM